MANCIPAVKNNDTTVVKLTALMYLEDHQYRYSCRGCDAQRCQWSGAVKPMVVGAENRWEKEFEALFFACKRGHVSLFTPCLVLFVVFD